MKTKKLFGILAAVIFAIPCAFADPAVAATSTAVSAELTEARGRISEVIEDAGLMEEVMKTLSAEEQVIYLGEVNAAIVRMPGSAESRAAAFLNVDSAALRTAKEGNLANVLAEAFATASVEALPLMAERYAEDLFNRDADPTKKTTDEQYVKVVANTMEVVNKRMAEVDGGGARAGFVAVMFILASNTITPEMVKSVGSLLPESVREDATSEWLPEAVGLDGAEKSYDAMTAILNGGVIPEPTRTLEIAGPQFQGVLLSDLTGFNTDPTAKTSERTPITDAIFNPFKLGRPIGGNSTAGGNNNPTPTPEHDDPVTPSEPEPEPYDGQTLH